VIRRATNYSEGGENMW